MVPPLAGRLAAQRPYDSCSQGAIPGLEEQGHEPGKLFGRGFERRPALSAIRSTCEPRPRRTGWGLFVEGWHRVARRKPASTA